MDRLGIVSKAVSSGLDRVSGALGYKPVTDLDIYKQLKANKFVGMVEKYGEAGTKAYIQEMETKLLKESSNG